MPLDILEKKSDTSMKVPLLDDARHTLNLYNRPGNLYTCVAFRHFSIDHFFNQRKFVPRSDTWKRDDFRIGYVSRIQ